MAGNRVAKEQWAGIEMAWGLKQQGAFNEEEWTTQIEA